MSRRLRIWIDLSNTPHVLFFEPVIRELERCGHTVEVTSRRFANTLSLIAARGVRARRIGAGFDTGRNRVLKQVAHHARTARLRAFGRRGFDVAASHFSYTQAAAALELGIPVFDTIDYEHRAPTVFRRAHRFMVPSVMSAAAVARLDIPAGIVRSYDGLKEHVYLADFRPADGVREQLGVGADQRLVTFRPIADHAMYTDHSGDGVQRRLLEHLAAERGACVLVLPRTVRQRRHYQRLARLLPALHVGDAALDGPSLIWASDLVVCGGGTMLREAAVLGVPAVSVFSGPHGAVDRWLADTGMVTLVRTVAEARRVRLERRRPTAPHPVSRAALSQIVQGICETAELR
jgi:uncharacterized protein